MKYEKSLKLIENTYKSLLKHSESSQWRNRIKAAQKSYLDAVAHALNVDVVAMTQHLADNNFSQDIFGFIFEDFCAKHFTFDIDNPKFDNLPIDFKAKNSWKLNDFTKQYLTELAVTNFSFWQVKGVDGQVIKLESYPRTDKTCELKDPRLIPIVAPGMILLAKLILVDETIYPGAIITPIEKQLVDEIVDEMSHEAEKFLLSTQKEALETQIELTYSDTYIKNVFAYNNLGHVIFKHWAMDCYLKTLPSDLDATKAASKHDKMPIPESQADSELNHLGSNQLNMPSGILSEETLNFKLSE